VAQDSAAGGSPAAGAGLAAVARWPFVAGFAVFGALFFAYRWAAPGQGESLGWFAADLLVIALFAGMYLIQLARVGFVRLALTVLPFWAVGLVRRAAQFLADGWAGGWTLGVVGAAVGLLAGVASGWLFAGWFASTLVTPRSANRIRVENRDEPTAAADRPHD
jgi:hypothetical protein